jgi:hypothetical protein
MSTGGKEEEKVSTFAGSMGSPGKFLPLRNSMLGVEFIKLAILPATYLSLLTDIVS